MNINITAKGEGPFINLELSKLDAQILDRVLVYFLDGITNFQTSMKILDYRSDVDDSDRLYATVANIQKKLYKEIVEENEDG